MAASRTGRDRDERGRPKNARPRDELGRPLPRGAKGVLEDMPEPDSPEEALRLGIEYFNRRRFFQAHEMWEEAWHPSPAPERDFWQGITQIAVGFTHFQRGNAKGAATLLRRGCRKLDSYGESFHGVPLRDLAAAARAAADVIEREGTGIDLDFPTIPEPAPGGAAGER